MSFEWPESYGNTKSSSEKDLVSQFCECTLKFFSSGNILLPFLAIWS